MDVFSDEYLNWIEKITIKKGSINDRENDDFAPFLKDFYYRIHDYYKENYVFSIDSSCSIFSFNYNGGCYLIGERYDSDSDSFIYSLTQMHVIGEMDHNYDIESIRNNIVPSYQLELKNRMNMIKSCINDLQNMGVPLMRVYGETYSYVLKLMKRDNN